MTRPSSLFLHFGRRASVILLIAAWSASAFTADRSELKGYDDFPFGMAEADVRTRINVASEKTDSIADYSSLLLLDENGSVSIRGINFHRRFAFRDGKLTIIQLMNETSESVTGCDNWFDRIYGAIKAQYGDPDTDVERTNFSGVTKITSTRFTFANSAAIVLGGIWTGTGMSGVEKCEILVTYEASKSGSSF